MFHFFERKRLVRKGLASAKIRRRRTRSELLCTLETGQAVKGGIFVLFCIGLAMLIFYGAPEQSMKKLVIALLIFATALAQLWVNHPVTFSSNSRISLMFGAIMTHLIATKFILVLGHHVDGTPDYILFGVPVLLLVPYALAPLICSVLLGKNQGLYAATFVSLWGSVILWASPDMDEEKAFIYLVTGLICGFVAVFVTLQVRRRSRLIRAGFFVGLATWMLALALGNISQTWDSFPTLDWQTLGWQSMAAVGSGILTAMIVGGALPIMETLFGLTTDISWLEAADLNHPLLRRLTIEAPGTYHHSLVVANLAESAAEVIGANPTMCRVCAYFHDIGKLVKPEYFTENMRAGRNPHDDLAPTMSALIIIAHVKEGVDLALKHKLSQRIIDVIQEHHGTSMVGYFHKRALQQQEDARQGGKIMNIREEDIPEVREESFRYGGPRPQSRESGIISLADACESASRCLEKVTPNRLEQLIHDIIEKRIIDGQLDECDLTMREINAIAENFAYTLTNMLHSRIAYPTDTAAPRPETFRFPENAPPVSAA
jgi:putative nucleotidyltransferase with HDIG domain